MKKRKIILATIILVILITAVCLTGCSSDNEGIATNPSYIDGLDSYNTLKAFVELFPDRTSGNTVTVAGTTINNADLAAEWIAQQFRAIGLQPSVENGLQEVKYTNNRANKRSETAYNVIYKIDSPNTDKRVVISAHYDNVSSWIANETAVGGEGVYTSAAGIAALIETAKALVSLSNLPYDVEFVAFGATEPGMFGSQKYLESLTAQQKTDTLLMVDYDRPAGGDSLYMYADEVDTDHYDYFYKAAKDNDLFISDIPANKREYLYSALPQSDLLYYNEPMVGDHYYFRLNGINTISFISANFKDRSNMLLSEMGGKKNVRYTSSDTLAEMVARHGGIGVGEEEISKRIDSAVSVIVKGLQGDEFVEVMQSSQNNRYDYSVFANQKIMTGIGYGVLGVIIISILVAYFILKPKAKPHTVIIDTPYGRVDMSKGVVYPASGQATQAPKPDEDIDPFGEEFTKKEPEIKEVSEKDIFGDY